jgi:hypothetical protein
MRIIKTCLFAQARKSRDLSWLPGKIPGSRTASRRLGNPHISGSEKLPAKMNTRQFGLSFPPSLPMLLSSGIGVDSRSESRLIQTELDAWSRDHGSWFFAFCFNSANSRPHLKKRKKKNTPEEYMHFKPAAH